MQLGLRDSNRLVFRSVMRGPNLYLYLHLHPLNSILFGVIAVKSKGEWLRHAWSTLEEVEWKMPRFVWCYSPRSLPHHAWSEPGWSADLVWWYKIKVQTSATSLWCLIKFLLCFALLSFWPILGTSYEIGLQKPFFFFFFFFLEGFAPYGRWSFVMVIEYRKNHFWR